MNTSTTLKVGYAYATGASNHVRRTQTVYPNGRILHSGYDSGLDDVLCRVSYLADDNGSGSPGQHLAEYDYLGASPRSQGGRGAGGEGIVRVTYPQPGIRWGLLGAGGGNDPYARMDRFGRVTEQIWRRCTAPAADLVRIQHAYDLAGNRLWRRDRVASAARKALDELYSYDGMNQLVALQRGRLNAARDALRDSTRTFGESWSLDMTGNWRGYDQDADGDGTPDLAQTRTHNVVNEITAITGGSWATPAHDRAGNMTTIPSPRLQGGRGAGGEGTSLACTYDAWNRLVKVVDASTSNTVAEYVYDGRNFRTVTKTYASGVLSEVRHAYYNGDWQLLEERVEAAPLPNPQSLIPTAQFVWGLRYIDNLVLRDRNADSNTSNGDLGKTGSGLEERLYALQDANWNVVAIADTSGAVQERYIYTAYGTPTFLDAAFVTRSASSFAWETLYTGRQYDSETGFLYYRERYLGSYLGRFLARDPIQADINLYRYVRNNPVIYVDPSGLEWVSGREGGQRTRFYHGQWYHWVDTPQQPQTPIIPSQPYASTIDPFSPDFDPNTWSNNHNWDFLGDFLNGTGPTNRFYGPDSLQTFQMRQSPGAAKLRDAFYASGCKGVKPGDPGSSYGTGEAAGGTTGDLSNTAFQVGGFGGATAVDNGNGTVTFTIYNDASRESFLYHGFYIFPVQNYQTGPMRTIRQTFQWTENIDKSKCCEKK
mgnify:CR=1 FL=1